MIWKCIIGFLVWAAFFHAMWRLGCWTSYYEGQKTRKDYLDFLKDRHQ